MVGVSRSDIEVFTEIVSYIKVHQYAPTVRELCELTGAKSTSTVHYHIHNLIDAGLLETDHGAGIPRALRLPGYKYVRCGNDER